MKPHSFLNFRGGGMEKIWSYKLSLQLTYQLSLPCKPSALNKLKCKNFRELQKAQELLVNLVILKKYQCKSWIWIYHEISKKYIKINAQLNSTWTSLTFRKLTYFGEIKKAGEYLVIVSATRASRDIKIPLCLSSSVW